MKVKKMKFVLIGIAFILILISLLIGIGNFAEKNTLSMQLSRLSFHLA